MAIAVHDNALTATFSPFMAVVAVSVFISPFSVALAAVSIFSVALVSTIAPFRVTLAAAVPAFRVTLAAAVPAFGVTLTAAVSAFYVTLTAAISAFGVTLAAAMSASSTLTLPTATPFFHQNEVRITSNADQTEEARIQLNTGSKSDRNGSR
jgi:hypothetical protein